MGRAVRSGPRLGLFAGLGLALSGAAALVGYCPVFGALYAFAGPEEGAGLLRDLLVEVAVGAAALVAASVLAGTTLGVVWSLAARVRAGVGGTGGRAEPGTAPDRGSGSRDVKALQRPGR
jgi:hypothetical protein